MSTTTINCSITDNGNDESYTFDYTSGSTTYSQEYVYSKPSITYNNTGNYYTSNSVCYENTGTPGVVTSYKYVSGVFNNGSFYCQCPQKFSTNGAPSAYYCNQPSLNYIRTVTSNTSSAFNYVNVNIYEFDNVSCDTTIAPTCTGDVTIGPTTTSGITLQLNASTNATLNCPTSTTDGSYNFISYTPSTSATDIISTYKFTNITTGGNGNVITITQTSVVSNGIYIPDSISVSYTVNDASSICMAIGTLADIQFGILAIANSSSSYSQPDIVQGITMSINALMGIIYYFFPVPSN